MTPALLLQTLAFAKVEICASRHIQAPNIGMRCRIKLQWDLPQGAAQ